MLYFHPYKRMKQRLGFDAGAAVPLDYGLFAIMIPMIVGSIIGLMLQKFGLIGESFAFFIMVISVIAAAV
jgi:uncharacterized membrane protein YeaQ/YmgE (transglycosylase-associated protein family)